MKKSILSIFLSAVMCVSAFSMCALAEDARDEDDQDAAFDALAESEEVLAESEDTQVESEDALVELGDAPVESEKFGTYENDEIPIRDAFVLCYDGKYYLYGTRGETAFDFATEDGFFEVYESDDLETWVGPYTAFPHGGWDGEHEATCCFWAPEVYEIDGSFYFIASMTYPSEEGTDRYVCILEADNPLGPFNVVNDHLLAGNDATLYTQADADGVDHYYLISTYYGDEDVSDGVWITKLTDDLTDVDGDTMLIFSSDDVGYTLGGALFEGFDAYTTESGRTILMFAANQYGMSEEAAAEATFGGGYYISTLVYFDNGIIDNETGLPVTDYTFSNEVFAPLNCGHNSIFEDADGNLKMAVHFPNGVTGQFGPWYLAGDYGYPYIFDLEYDAENDTLIVDRIAFYDTFGEDYYNNMDADGCPTVAELDPAGLD